MLRRELSPLLSTIHALASNDASGALAAPLSIVRQDEVGVLVCSFNRLLNSLQQRE
jgi:HAMP domain-containing protein